MLFDPGTVTPHGSSGGGIEPRGYLHMLDLTRINRMLRPIKAKISAIQLDIRTQPSLGFALESSAPEAKASGGRDLRSRGQSSSRSANSRGQPNSPLMCSGTGAGTGSSITVSASGANAATEVLVKRFQSSLTDQFQDVVDKVWWRPFCDDYHLPSSSSTSSIREMGLKPKSNTLGIMSAFAVGRVVAGLSEDDADIAEKYYHIMPAHMRRFAVLEHLVDLCLSQIRIGQLIIPLTLVCARRRADTQTIRLLRHLLECQNQSFQLDLPWAYNIAQMVESGDVWMTSLIQHSPRQFFNSQSQKFIAMIEPRHRATLIRLAFEAQLDDSMMISERTKQTRLHNWSVLLIKDSLQYHEAAESTDPDQMLTRNPCDDTLEYMAKRLLGIASNRMKDSSFSSSEAETLALGPALHSLYIAATRPPCPRHDSAVDEWIGLLDTRAMSSVRLSDFEAISRSYGTLPNLNALAVLLDGLGLYALSMKLLNRMLNSFAYLERNTGSQDGKPYRITRSGLEDHLHEVEGRRRNHASNDGWCYDGMLGDWVQRTPDSKKIVCHRMDGEDFSTPARGLGPKMFDFGDDPFDGGSSSQEGYALPNARLRGKTSASANQYPSRDGPVTSTRRLSRFSLTPMARSTAPITDDEHSDHVLSESDAGQDEDFEYRLGPINSRTDLAFRGLSASPPPFSASEDRDDYAASSQDHEAFLSEEESSDLEDNYGRNRLQRNQTPGITVVSDPEEECGSDDYIATQGIHHSDDTDFSDRDEQEEDGEEEEEEEEEEEKVDRKSAYLLASDSDPEYVPSMRLESPLASLSPPTSYREFLTSVEMPATIRRLSISGRPLRFADAISSGDEYVYYPKDHKGHSQRSEDDDDNNAESAPCQESDSTNDSRTPALSWRQTPSSNTLGRRKSRKLFAKVGLESDISSSSDEYTPRSKTITSRAPRGKTAVSRREDDEAYEPTSAAQRRMATRARRQKANNASIGINGRHGAADLTLVGRSLRSRSGDALLGRGKYVSTSSSDEEPGPLIPKRTPIAKRRQQRTAKNEEPSEIESSGSGNHSFNLSSYQPGSHPAFRCSPPLHSKSADPVRKKRSAIGNDDSSEYDPGPRLSKRAKIQERRQTRVFDSEESCVVISDDESEGQRARDNSDDDHHDSINSYEEVEDSAGCDDDDDDDSV